MDMNPDRLFVPHSKTRGKINNLLVLPRPRHAGCKTSPGFLPFTRHHKGVDVLKSVHTELTWRQDRSTKTLIACEWLGTADPDTSERKDRAGTWFREGERKETGTRQNNICHPTTQKCHKQLHKIQQLLNIACFRCSTQTLPSFQGNPRKCLSECPYTQVSSAVKHS